MSGLIGNSIGASFGDSMGSFGKLILADAASKREESSKAEERAALRQDKAAQYAEANAIAREKIEASAGGKDNISADQVDSLIAQNSYADKSTAMDAPEVKAWRTASDTGDYTELKTKYPEGFEQQQSAKLAFIGRMRQQYSMVGHNKDRADADQADFQTGVGKGIISGEITSDKGASAVGGSMGKPTQSGTGDTVFGAYGGKPSSTPLGEAKAADMLKPDKASSVDTTALRNQASQMAERELGRISDIKIPSKQAAYADKLRQRTEELYQQLLDEAKVVVPKTKGSNNITGNNNAVGDSVGASSKSYKQLWK